MNDDDIDQREGYMIFVEPIVGFIQLFMTGVTTWVIAEVLKTDHGRAFVQHLPVLIKTTLHTYI
jgi:hypothetical protein